MKTSTSLGSITPVMIVGKSTTGIQKIYLRIWMGKHEKYAFLPTSVRVDASHWDHKKHQFKQLKRISNVRLKQRNIQAAMEKLDGMIQALIASGQVLSRNLLEEKWKGGSQTDLASIARRYIREQRKENRQPLAESTKKQYETHIVSYERFGRRVDISEITPQWLTDYQDWLMTFGRVNRKKPNSCKGSPLEPASVMSHMTFWNSLLGWAYRNQIIERNPRDFWQDKIKPKKKPKIFFVESEIERLEMAYLTGELRNHVISNAERDINYRDKLHDSLQQILAGVFSGLRYSDVSDLQSDSVNGQFLQVTQKKTDSIVRVPIGARLGRILNHDGPSLFNVPVRKNGTINKHMRLICKILGIHKKVTFHKTRHTFATYMINKGVRLEIVAELMGHKNIESTRIYATITDEGRREGIDVLDAGMSYPDTDPPAPVGSSAVVPLQTVVNFLAFLPEAERKKMHDQLTQAGYDLPEITGTFRIA